MASPTDHDAGCDFAGYGHRYSPLVINLARQTMWKALPGLVCMLFFGGSAVIAPSIGQVDDHGPGVRLMLYVIGTPLLAPGLLILFSLPAMLRSRRLVIDEQGVRYEDSSNQAFTMTWPEVSEVRVSRTIKKSQNSRFSTTLVRLLLTPATPEVLDRHPALRRLSRHRGDGAVRLPLGPTASNVKRLNDALSRFAGPRYLGVVDEGNGLSMR